MPHTVIQEYEPFAANQRFRIIGEPMLTLGGELLSDEEAAGLIELLEGGIQQHPAVVELWPQWRA